MIIQLNSLRDHEKVFFVPFLSRVSFNFIARMNILPSDIGYIDVPQELTVFRKCIDLWVEKLGCERVSDKTIFFS